MQQAGDSDLRPQQLSSGVCAARELDVRLCAEGKTWRRAGLVHLRCNGGHVWMNAEMVVVPHPYYAVTDESGRFELTDVPPGTYQIVAWHEGWILAGKEQAYDVLTERTVQRPIFNEPRSWEKSVTVNASQPSVVTFLVSTK
jgi:hypothetical protein